MPSRWGLGPVFAFEWLTGARRWQMYVMRSFVVVLMLLGLWLVWLQFPTLGRAATIQQQASMGRAFFGTSATILLCLVGLVAPAATAGAICLDKARGNLALLFATDLSNAEIVLGKLGSRLVPVFGLILCAAPVLAIATLFGGVDPLGLFGTLLVITAWAVFGCATALTLSVWGRKTHEVLMATYVIGLVVLLSPMMLSAIRWLFPITMFPDLDRLLRLNPVYLVATAIDAPARTGSLTIGIHATFFGVWMAVSAVLVALSTWRLRRVAVRQMGRGERSGARGSGRWRIVDRLSPWFPSLGTLGRRSRRFLDRNPVFWRECHRQRPSWSSRFVWASYILICGGFSLLVIAIIVVGSNPDIEMAAMTNAGQVAVGLLLLSVSASTSLAEERQRGSLDVLLATPMSTRSIVLGKWLGAFRAVPPLLILPAILSLVLMSRTGRIEGVILMIALILSYGAAITSLGVGLATWVPRLGRAVGLSVGLFVAITIGWLVLSSMLLANHPDEGAIGIMAGSPLMGVGLLSVLLSEVEIYDEYAPILAWTVFWTIAYAGLAVGLLLLTIVTFDRCLGRIRESSSVFDREIGLRSRRGPPMSRQSAPATADRTEEMPRGDGPGSG